MTNDRHGPAIETTTATTRADILVMVVMWPPGSNSLLWRGKGFHLSLAVDSAQCSSAAAFWRLGVRRVSSVLEWRQCIRGHA